MKEEKARKAIDQGYLNLKGGTVEFDTALELSKFSKTVICNGKLVFSSPSGILFGSPYYNPDPVQVNLLSLRDLEIVNTRGTGLLVKSGGKETTIDNVRITAEGGGAYLKDWDGGSIQRLYTLSCGKYGVKIERFHAGQLHIESRQTKAGPGVIANALRVVSGTIYSESNDLYGIEFSDCDETALSLHCENNNWGVTGKRTHGWPSLGHQRRQISIERCFSLSLAGRWGADSSQYSCKDASQWFSERVVMGSLPKENRIRWDDIADPWSWDKRWPNPVYRPTVLQDRGTQRLFINFRSGCFLRRNQNTLRHDYWYPFDLVGLPVLEEGSLILWEGYISIPDNIRDELNDQHQQGNENGLGTVTFERLGYNAGFNDKGVSTLHSWQDDGNMCTGRTFVKSRSEDVQVTYKPNSGTPDWDNPEFEAVLDLRYYVIPAAQ